MVVSYLETIENFSRKYNSVWSIKWKKTLIINFPQWNYSYPEICGQILRSGGSRSAITESRSFDVSNCLNGIQTEHRSLIDLYIKKKTKIANSQISQSRSIIHIVGYLRSVVIHHEISRSVSSHMPTSGNLFNIQIQNKSHTMLIAIISFHPTEPTSSWYVLVWHNVSSQSMTFWEYAVNNARNVTKDHWLITK